MLSSVCMLFPVINFLEGNISPYLKKNIIQSIFNLIFVSIVNVHFGFSDAAAMLTVEDDEFWEGVSPVEFGDLPALQDAVTVVGYPIGGDTISVTSGVVSRIEILSYVHGSTELLGLQVLCISFDCVDN